MQPLSVLPYRKVDRTMVAFIRAGPALSAETRPSRSCWYCQTVMPMDQPVTVLQLGSLTIPACSASCAGRLREQLSQRAAPTFTNPPAHSPSRSFVVAWHAAVERMFH